MIPALFDMNDGEKDAFRWPINSPRFWVCVGNSLCVAQIFLNTRYNNVIITNLQSLTKHFSFSELKIFKIYVYK